MEFKKIVMIIVSIIFISDLIYKNYFEPKPQPPINKEKDIIENSYESNRQDIQVNPTKLKSNLNNNKKQDGELDDKESNSSTDGEQNSNLHYINYNKIQDDDDEFEGVLEQRNPIIKMEIIYDPKMYKELVDTYSEYLMSNYSLIDVNKKVYPLPAKQQFIITGILILEVTFCLFVMGSNILKSYIKFIPEKVFDVLNKTKYLFSAGFILIHQFYFKKLSYSYAFEVYLEGKIKHTSIQAKVPPTYEEIVKLLSQYKLN